MEEENNKSQDLFKNYMGAITRKLKEPVVGHSTYSEWPTLPARQRETSLPASYIPPDQKKHR